VLNLIHASCSAAFNELIWTKCCYNATWIANVLAKQHLITNNASRTVKMCITIMRKNARFLNNLSLQTFVLVSSQQWCVQFSPTIVALSVHQFDQNAILHVLIKHISTFLSFCQTTNLGWSWSSNVRDVM